MLTFFRSDMGLVAAKKISDSSQSDSFAIGFFVSIPVLDAQSRIFIARGIKMSSSTSYIAISAGMRTIFP